MSLSLGVLADLHFSLDRGEGGAWVNPYDFAGLPERIDQACARFAEEEVDLVVLAGDLSHCGDARSLHAVLERCLDRSPRPVHVVAGNHDVATDEGRQFAETERLTSRRVALTPAGAKRAGGLRLSGVHATSRSGWFRARLEAPPAVPVWQHDPTLLISHFPLLSHATRMSERGLPYPGDVLGRAAVAAELAWRDAPTVVLSGHIHARDSLCEGPVLQLTQAALIEPPYEASIVRVGVTAGRVSVTRRAISLDGPEPLLPEPLLVSAEQQFEYVAGAWHEIANDTPDPLPRSTPWKAVPTAS